MSKAILVMDMPSSCDKCPLFNSHYSDMTCRANGNGINYPYPKDKRQDWCPLKPMPIKRSTEYNPARNPYITQGYNVCIDELLSEKE